MPTRPDLVWGARAPLRDRPELLRPALRAPWLARARPVDRVELVRLPVDDLLPLRPLVLPERGLVVAVFATLARY